MGWQEQVHHHDNQAEAQLPETPATSLDAVEALHTNIQMRFESSIGRFVGFQMFTTILVHRYLQC